MLPPFNVVSHQVSCCQQGRLVEAASQKVPQTPLGAGPRPDDACEQQPQDNAHRSWLTTKGLNLVEVLAA